MTPDLHQIASEMVVLAVRLEFDDHADLVANLLLGIPEEVLAVVAGVAIGAFAGMLKGYARDHDVTQDAALQHFALRIYGQ